MPASALHDLCSSLLPCEKLGCGDPWVRVGRNLRLWLQDPGITGKGEVK